MAKIIFASTVILSLTSWTRAQMIFAGWCPEVPIVQNFNNTAYAGLWYEIEHYWFIAEALGTCVRVDYVANGDQTFAAVIRQQVDIGGIHKQWNNPGHTKPLGAPGEGSFLLEVLVTQSPVPFVFPYPYKVLDTDYENYTIKYLCIDFGLYHAKTVWILGRKKYIEPYILDNIHRNLARWGIDPRKLLKADLSKCPPGPY